MTTDEFDKEHSSPLAPDERFWRHPAEQADAERNKHLSHVPPLGRRLTALTATVSLVASMAVLFIAVPKGISEYVDGNDTPTTIQQLRVKNSLLSFVAIADGAKGPTTAVSLGGGCWLVAAESVDIGEPIWLTFDSGTEARVRYFTLSPDQSVVLLRTGIDKLATPHTDWNRYLAPHAMTDLQGLLMLDTHGLHRITEEPVFTMQSEPNEIPVMTDSPINGTAAIVQDPNALVGVAATTQQSTWFLSKEMLMALTLQTPQPAH